MALKRRHEGWWCAVGRPVEPPAELGQPRPTPRRSGRCRRIECSSYGPFGPDQRSFKTEVNFSNTLSDVSNISSSSLFVRCVRERKLLVPMIEPVLLGLLDRCGCDG